MVLSAHILLFSWYTTLKCLQRYFLSWLPVYFSWFHYYIGCFIYLLSRFTLYFLLRYAAYEEEDARYMLHTHIRMKASFWLKILYSSFLLIWLLSKVLPSCRSSFGSRCTSRSAKWIWHAARQASRKYNDDAWKRLMLDIFIWEIEICRWTFWRLAF